MAIRWGVTFPFAPGTLKEQIPVIAETEELGYTELWTAEANTYDGFTPLAVAAMTTSRARLGTAIVASYTRGPLVLAQHAATLDELAPGRVVLGLGSSARTIVEDWNGVPFRKPVEQMADTVRAVRSLLAGERVTGQFETLQLAGSRYGRPVGGPIQIYLAALRSRMLRLAGQLGDGVIINMMSPSDVPRCLAQVDAGAHEAGRSPGEIDRVCRIFVIVSDDKEAAIEAAKRYLAGYLPVATYRRQQEWLGRGDALRPMHEAWEQGDRRRALEVMPLDVVHDLVVIGSPEECKDRILEYCANGVQMPMLAFVGGDPVESMRAMSPARLKL